MFTTFQMGKPCDQYCDEQVLTFYRTHVLIHYHYRSCMNNKLHHKYCIYKELPIHILLLDCFQCYLICPVYTCHFFVQHRVHCCIIIDLSLCRIYNGGIVGWSMQEIFFRGCLQAKMIDDGWQMVWCQWNMQFAVMKQIEVNMVTNV